MNSNLHLVTGYAGEEHVTSSDEGSLNAALMGEGQFVLERGNQFAASIISNNKVRVADGDILMQGRHIRLKENTYVELNFDNGTQGYKRNDLIVVRYTKDSITDKEEANLVVIKGTPSETTPADPEYVSGDIIHEHTLQNDMPLYRVSFDGLNIQPLTSVFKIISTIETKTEKMELKISEELSRLEEEIDEKLADAGKPVVSNVDDMLLIEEYGKYTADAKTVGEELDKLKGFTPIVDSTGKITGYKTKIGGADTVFPFSSGNAIYLGTGSSFDIKAIYPDWANLTVDNFTYGCKTVTAISYSNGKTATAGNISVSRNVTANYSNGVLKINSVSGRSVDASTTRDVSVSAGNYFALLLLPT